MIKAVLGGVLFFPLHQQVLTLYSFNKFSLNNAGEWNWFARDVSGNSSRKRVATLESWDWQQGQDCCSVRDVRDGRWEESEPARSRREEQHTGAQSTEVVTCEHQLRGEDPSLCSDQCKSTGAAAGKQEGSKVKSLQGPGKNRNKARNMLVFVLVSALSLQVPFRFPCTSLSDCAASSQLVPVTAVTSWHQAFSWLGLTGSSEHGRENPSLVSHNGVPQHLSFHPTK